MDFKRRHSKKFGNLAFLVGIATLLLFPSFVGGIQPKEYGETILSSQLSQFEWIDKQPTISPDRKNHPAMSFDQSVGKLILFSGRNFNGTVLNDTWAYDFQSNRWEYRNPSVSAPHRQYSDMTYISSINKSAIFGGAIAGGIGSNDFWLYDYSTNLWEEIVSANRPPIRNFHAMTYSPTENKLVVTGGSAGRDRLDDAWFFDFDTMDWSEIGKLPFPADTHSLNYYPITNTVLLFDTVLGNIYELKFDTNSWEIIETTNNPGFSKNFVDIVYDPVVDLFILFGGLTDNAGSDETWLFDYNLKTWYFAEMATKPPPRHTDSNMEFDSLNNVTLLFGGSDETIYYGDTWALSISTELYIGSLPTTNPNIIIPTNSETPSTDDSKKSTNDESPSLFLHSAFLTLVLSSVWRRKQRVRY